VAVQGLEKAVAEAELVHCVETVLDSDVKTHARG
jgi:hypothetical protein